MLRSLFSGITGLRSHQQMMDVVGNNIANVNTAGYKTATTVFNDVISQQVVNAGAPVVGDQAVGGVNGAAIGLGVKLGTVSTNYAQGSAQLTGRQTDMMIQGDGFFVVNNAGTQLYTRAGNFTLDANGNLVGPEGYLVQGWMADATGTIDTNATIADIDLPVGQLQEPVITTAMTLGGNLDSRLNVGDTYQSSIIAYDALGNEINVPVTYTKGATDGAGNTTWTLSADGAGGNTVDVVFDNAGVLTTAGGVAVAAGATPTVNLETLNNALGAAAGNGILTTTLSGLTQYASDTTVATLSQDGYPSGDLNGISVTRDGIVIGIFSNGRKEALAQVALAIFNNPGGLEKVGNSTFGNTVNSGVAQIGAAVAGGRGSIAGGTLEMSNVDLAAEFTNLIVAQRGFQASSRTMSAADEMLQDLVNIKR